MEVFGVFVAICLLASTVSGQLPSQEILALLEFKKGVTLDPTGYILDSWSANSVDVNGCPSSWNGIVCNAGNVAVVVLDNLNLAADVDIGVFANLTMLFKLSMSNNSISGVLGSNVGNFRSLNYFDISNNLFSGNLPEAIGRIGTLKNFSVAGNNFTGLLPKSIVGLTSILSLDLSRNSFSGVVPSSLTKLKSLVSLKLSFNEFSKRMPAGFQKLTNLKELDLSWNRLDGGVDWIFLMQSTVAHVDLSGNLLISLSTKELKFLSDISDTVKYLNLSNNQITGSLIDGGTLSTFGSLKVLDLSYNQISGELPGFSYVYELEVLRLGSNRFSGSLPSVLLKGDSLVLTELDLSTNNLSGGINMITSPTLQILNISSNSLSGNLPLIIGGCSVVDLSRNQFTGNLSALEKWSDGIEFIDLSQNNLAGSIPESTSQFLRLNYLNLSSNSLTGSPPVVLASYPKLTTLDLSSNKLSGIIPNKLLTSPTLQELHLQENLFSGGILLPALPRKSNLQVLDISRNRFSGDFPVDFNSLSSLQILNIAENNLSGHLPVGLSELISLISLDLSHNFLTGSLPKYLSSSLESFNVSYNDLSGIVPVNLRKFPDSSFHPGNSGLRIPSSQLKSDSNANTEKSMKNKIQTLIKVIIIVTCVVIVFILILLAIVVHHKRKSRKSVLEDGISKDSVKGRETSDTHVVSTDELKEACGRRSAEGKKVAVVSNLSPPKTSHVSCSPDSGDSYMAENFGRLDAVQRSPERLAGDLHFLDDTIAVTPEELSRAPAEVLGRSSHGTSYKATLDNGILLTVKWLRQGVAKPKKEFVKEAKKFANIRHPNVVGLRGYYWGPSQHEKLLLADYISPGSLASFLYGRPERKSPPLTWPQRLKIAVDIARGLNYLHLDRSLPHGNMKASNVLLEGLDLNAKVAGYGLHRLMTQAGTIEQISDLGVLGYRAPELAVSKKPSPSFKADVYGFGVILLELLTGRCAGDLLEEEGCVTLIDWVRLRVTNGLGLDCFDLSMNSESSRSDVDNVNGMREMLGIALRCIKSVSERPVIKSVYEDLSSV